MFATDAQSYSVRIRCFLGTGNPTLPVLGVFCDDATQQRRNATQRELTNNIVLIRKELFSYR